MIGRICLGLSLPLLLGAGETELPKSWKEIICKDGKFKVMMPKEPTESKQLVKTATGQLNVKMLVAEGKHEALFVVSYTDYTDAELKKNPVAKRLDQARDGAVTSTGGMLRSEKAIAIKKHPGRDLVIEKEGESIARMRIYLVHRRLYQVMVLGTAPAKEIGEFLDSFALSE